MTPEELDRILDAPAVSQAPDAELLARISDRARSGLKPVRPMGSPVLHAAVLLAFGGGVALLGSRQLGRFGWHKMSAWQAELIFPLLGGVAILAAMVSLRAMIPGSRRLLDPRVLLASASLVFFAVAFVMFQDFRADRFVIQGWPCLRGGLSWAGPAALCTWLWLRRGYAVDRGAAGIAAGTFAGLAGFAMLELHCPNFRTLHVAVWHVAVVPASALVMWALYSLGLKRKDAELMQ